MILNRIDTRPLLVNIKEGGEGNTVGLFLKLFESLIHNLRVRNDAAISEEVIRNQGAINELQELINIFIPKPDKKKEE